jgi:hypothetical protein
MAVGMEDCDQCLVQDNLAKPMRVWGKDRMTWPDIIAGGSAKMEARVGLATECSGHPFATMTPKVGARGF